MTPRRCGDALCASPTSRSNRVRSSSSGPTRRRYPGGLRDDRRSAGASALRSCETWYWSALPGRLPAAASRQSSSIEPVGRDDLVRAQSAAARAAPAAAARRAPARGPARRPRAARGSGIPRLALRPPTLPPLRPASASAQPLAQRGLVCLPQEPEYRWPREIVSSEHRHPTSGTVPRLPDGGADRPGRDGGRLSRPRPAASSERSPSSSSPPS